MAFFQTVKENFSFMREDFKVYWEKRGTNSYFQSLIYLLTCHGWHIMIWFRIGKIIYAVPVPVISHMLKLVFRLFWFLLTTFYGISINPVSDIGKGFYIGHFGTIQIRGVFGDYCSVSQGVTVGSKGAGKSNGWPIFGDHVYIGAGAKIIGDISVGNNVVVGANAVVLKSVPDNHRAVGVPAKLHSISENSVKKVV